MNASVLLSPLAQTSGSFAYLGVCLVGFVLLLVLMILGSAIRIVPEYERLVVFRLGRCVGERGPGLVLLIPLHRPGVRVDLREQVREIPHQTSITKDNAPISIDFLWYYKVRRPGRQRAAGRQLRAGRAGHGHHHPALGHRRHPARRRALAARAHQRSCCAPSWTRSPSAGASR